MEFADVNDWDFIVVQAKYIHRLKMTKSSGPTLEVLIDGKESLFRDESIINNEKNCNTLCKLLLSADDVCYSEYAFKNDIITKLFENIDKLRRKFNKPSMRQMPYG
ncbi:hypothetical protein GLOIN_2v1594863 [Rhizophagus clarus]|nr:hypothetical protein GLOIN_2v1594863 [Rhizophagus clarus]